MMRQDDSIEKSPEGWRGIDLAPHGMYRLTRGRFAQLRTKPSGASISHEAWASSLDMPLWWGLVENAGPVRLAKAFVGLDLRLFPSQVDDKGAGPQNNSERLAAIAER